MSRDARPARWLSRFRIADYADRRAEELSKGNQQKVQFIAAILHRPTVLLMDEPFTGLDPGQPGDPARGVPRAPRRGPDARLLDPPDGRRRGPLRVGRDRRPRARRGRGHGRGAETGQRSADHPARTRRRSGAGLAWRAARASPPFDQGRATSSSRSPRASSRPRSWRPSWAVVRPSTGSKWPTRASRRSSSSTSAGRPMTMRRSRRSLARDRPRPVGPPDAGTGRRPPRPAAAERGHRRAPRVPRPCPQPVLRHLDDRAHGPGPRRRARADRHPLRRPALRHGDPRGR